MSTTTPPRPSSPRSLTDGFGLPELIDVRLPRRLARVPRWLLASVVLVLLVLVSLHLRMTELGGTLWWAETNSIGIANQSLGGVLHACDVTGSAPFYYLLLHFWISGFGDSVSSARDLSLICALACIPVGGWAAWSLAGERAGFYGAVVFAFSSILTEYGQQAQPYALLGLLGLLATTGFLHAFVYRRRGYLWLFVAAVVLGLYTQGSTGIFLFGAVAALLVVIGCAPAEARRGIIRDGLIAAAAIVVLYIPWIPATVHQIAHATYPWHYTPVIQAYMPSNLVGGERVDADLLVIGVLGVAPFIIARSRRRDPDGVALYALFMMVTAALIFGVLANIAAPVLIFRYYMMLAMAMLIFAALTAARAKVIGFVAIVLFVVFCADPAAFATSHPSNMNEVAAQLGGRLHQGDVVAMGQPEQASLAWYYLPAGLKWASTAGPIKDPRYMDWDDALSHLQHAAAAPTLGHLVASLKPGQQLLFIRPLTEGAKNWEAPWTTLVQLRSAQWGNLLTQDVARGTLTQVATAPENYPGDCCVASSAILYRKS